MKQKIVVLEKSLDQVEKERSELQVRASMAEQQLATMNELMISKASEYKKKINELQKRLGIK